MQSIIEIHPFIYKNFKKIKRASLVAQTVKNLQSACNAGYLGLIPRRRKSLRKGNDYPLQNSCLGNFIDREGNLMGLSTWVTMCLTGLID